MLLMMKKILKKKYDKIKSDSSHIIKITKKLVQQDPRRILHSIKVGFAITLVSLLYYFDILYQGLGVSAMWAVLTTVVVFEFSVGATLGKGVNRSLATVIGGMSAVGAHTLSSLPGKKLEPIFVGLSVFLIASMTTFIRFFPRMKARFDYGLLVFILTFCLICVSGYRNDEVIEMAHKRISAILIGGTAAVIICVFIFPVWAGTDLHKLITADILTLSLYFQGFGTKYFKISRNTSSDDNNLGSLAELKYVVDSKTSIDSLLNFVKWEPRHGEFKKDHPWTEYRKIYELCRHCGYKAQALHGYLHSQYQAPKEVKDKFQEACIEMSEESGRALNEVSIAMSKMRKAPKAKPHLENAKEAALSVNLLLNSNLWENVKLSDVTNAATVASLLADVVGCTEEICEAVQEFASLAKFKDADDDDDSNDDKCDDDSDNVEDDDKVAPELNNKVKVAPEFNTKLKVAPEFNSKVKVANQGSIKHRAHANHVVLIEGSSPAASPKPHGPHLPSVAVMHQQTDTE